MKCELQITFRNMKPSAEVEGWIQAEVAKLETFYDRLTGCHVAVEIPHRHHLRGKQYHVRIDLFVPKGVPKLILPAIVIIEVLSFFSRPVSHSVRLFANMLAGHITLQVFAGFIIMLASAGILGWFGAALPFIMVVMLTALEFLVAFLQAYVFAILTCIYLNDAIHPGH